MHFLLVLFLALLSVGACAMLFFAPRAELKDSFFSLIACVFGTSMVLAAGLAHVYDGGLPRGLWYPLLMAAGAFALVHAWAAYTRHRAAEVLARPGLLVGGLGGSVLLAATLFEVGGVAGLAALALATTTSAALLGATSAGMLCGHWYLIDRKLDFWILRRFVKVLAAAVVAKVLALGVGLWLGASGPAPMFEALTTCGSLPNMVFGARLLVGGLVPLGMTYMIWDCTVRESNQSATGLLYVLLSLVMAGEALALGLAALTGIYL